MFIDDERFPIEKEWVEWIIVRSYDEWVQIINELWFPKHVQFDHDLWEWLTWYDFAKYLVELDLKENVFWSDFSFDVHSQNPVGKKNILDYLNWYLRFKQKKEV